MNTELTIPPVGAFKFTKTCLCCRKTYGSNARNTRFCSDPCQVKYSTLNKKRRKEYQLEKESQQIWVASHTLARKVLAEEVRQGRRQMVCVRCLELKELHVHHNDGQHLNNLPTNLVYCCQKHHSEMESELRKSTQGPTV